MLNIVHMTMELVFGGCPNQLLPELGVTVFLGFQACKLAVAQTISLCLISCGKWILFELCHNAVTKCHIPLCGAR
jgi:hypothetical protein